MDKVSLVRMGREKEAIRAEALTASRKAGRFALERLCSQKPARESGPGNGAIRHEEGLGETALNAVFRVAVSPSRSRNRRCEARRRCVSAASMIRGRSHLHVFM